MENPIVILSEKVQKKFGENIETRVIEKHGPDHMPIITCSICLPDGTCYTASGKNKKEAKQEAAQDALNDYDW